MPDFLSMGISANIVNKLTENGIAIPTPIQEQAIPLVMDGKDVIAQAQTGTGKTFAFILPILEKINLNATQIQALIVTPTRELALQITNEVEKLIQNNDNINVLAAYGGQDVEKQLNKLKKNIQIVVGTPGRLLDHIRRETIDLLSLSTLVLDEADQMLHIGFLDEVEEIIKATPKRRQTLLFSATMPPEIRNLAKKHMSDPKYIQVEKTQGPAQSVKQMAIHTIDRAKQATLIELIETHRPFLAVVFCRTKRRVSKLYDALKAHGFPCDELHGDLTQAKREQVMKKFREAEIQLLIATDVAARGLDVEGVTHVYNYDIPQDAESYIHRIGRTGRAGMTGLAITLYSSKDRPALDLIEKELNITINKQNIGNMKKAENEAKGIEEKDTSKTKRKPNRKQNNKGYKTKTTARSKNNQPETKSTPRSKNQSEPKLTSRSKDQSEPKSTPRSKNQPDSKFTPRGKNKPEQKAARGTVKPAMKKKGAKTLAGKRRNSR
ncbi:DEAD/DEAH box helicase [Bacillus sp. DNRA2]|uniref:DEAD/DEAH box helicase n=1 Tax=Bacillus sp. DNRA2 TaxID=2723053 RepID=UPI00145E7C36|nr:DEAD/DEAH box helicase [Bacillus sp. DNRA2]NMD69859.1 DEAD/DEAH box helicase [Bacillus sp. DNRA2]